MAVAVDRGPVDRPRDDRLAVDLVGQTNEHVLAAVQRVGDAAVADSARRAERELGVRLDGEAPDPEHDRVRLMILGRVAGRVERPRVAAGDHALVGAGQVPGHELGQLVELGAPGDLLDEEEVRCVLLELHEVDEVLPVALAELGGGLEVLDVAVVDLEERRVLIPDGSPGWRRRGVGVGVGVPQQHRRHRRHRRPATMAARRRCTRPCGRRRRPSVTRRGRRTRSRTSRCPRDRAVYRGSSTDRPGSSTGPRTAAVPRLDRNRRDVVVDVDDLAGRGVVERLEVRPPAVGDDRRALALRPRHSWTSAPSLRAFAAQ